MTDFSKQKETFSKVLGIADIDSYFMECPIEDLDVILEYDGTPTELISIVEKYKEDLIKMMQLPGVTYDKVMTDSNGRIRHDLNMSENVDFEKVIKSLGENSENLNVFEQNAKNCLAICAAQLVNIYGIEKLNESKDDVSKDIYTGVFPPPRYYDEDIRKDIEKRPKLYDTFGLEAIPYIENLELLKKRVASLENMVNPEQETILNMLKSGLEAAEKGIVSEDRSVLGLLEHVYELYEKLNRMILTSRLCSSEEEIIDNPSDERLFLLHFVPNGTNNFDTSKREERVRAADEYVREYVVKKYGREFDPSTDSVLRSRLIEQFEKSLDNPVDFSIRIPLKNEYTSRSLKTVVTKPTTDISCSFFGSGYMKPHLERKIAIGFSDVQLGAIKTLNQYYNNALDVCDFEKSSASASEIYDSFKAGRTNETLVDWTKIKPSYILVVKQTRDIDPELLSEARRLCELNNLPLKIYDQYTIEKVKAQNSYGKGLS